MDDGNPIIGKYLDGADIHLHPEMKEIKDHIEEWQDLAALNMNAEQREIIEEMRDVQINTHFMRNTKGFTPEQVIVEAVQWWREQWPWEVKPHMDKCKGTRDGLYNTHGYGANDKDKSMLLYGLMPDRIKTFGLAHNVNFWERDKGKCKNLELFYKLFPAMKISDYKGCA